MKDKIYMYPGYNSNHDLKAIEIQNTIVFGLTGAGKTMYLKGLLYDIYHHNNERTINISYEDCSSMSREDFIKFLENIKGIIETRLDWLKEKRAITSIPMLIVEEKECPFEEVVFCIDDFNSNIMPGTEEYRLLMYILTSSRLAGVHLFMSTTVSDKVCVDILSKFPYRACLDNTMGTLMAAIGVDVRDEFKADKRIVVFKDKGLITRQYDVYTAQTYTTDQFELDWDK